MAQCTVRIYVLSGDQNKPCVVLKWPQVCVMFDCGLDLKSLLSFIPHSSVRNSRIASLPEWQPPINSGVALKGLVQCAGQVFINGCPEYSGPEELLSFAEIDAVFLSNYKSFMALPFITERPEFRGKVYATDPTLQLGRLLIEEVVEYTERYSGISNDGKWKEPEVYKQFANAPTSNPKDWRLLYQTEALQKCISKVEVIAYREVTDVHGFLKVTAVSSGYAIGSCNWVAETDYERIVYLSASSSITAHPKLIDFSLLQNADTILLTSVSQAPAQSPDDMLREISVAVANTIRAGGNVLFPVYPTGVIYDLFEALGVYLEQTNCDVPIFFVSPVADSALAYANIYGEWLSDAKQQKIYVPEEPFGHSLLVKGGRLSHYSAIYDGLCTEFRSPCIVFAGHPSLRLGDAVHFMELWGNDSKNTVILTESDFNTSEILAPFQPLMMRALFCPIDTSLNFSQASKLLSDLSPSRIVVPAEYLKPPFYAPGRSDLMLQCSLMPTTFKRGQIISISFPRRFVKLAMDAKLASSVDLQSFTTGTSAASVLGNMSATNNHIELQRPESRTKTANKVPPNPYGSLEASTLTRAFSKAGFDVKSEKEKDGTTVLTFPKDSARIRIEAYRTHVIVDSNDKRKEETRRKLLNMLMEVLNKF